MAEVSLEDYTPLVAWGSSEELLNTCLQSQMEDDEDLSCRLQIPDLPEVLILVPRLFSEHGALHFVQGLQTTVTQFPLPCLSFMGHTSFEAVLTLRPNASSKEEIWAKNNLLLFEHEKKKEEKRLFQWEQTYWKLKRKTTVAPRELSSAVWEVAWGKGMASFQGKLRFHCLVGVGSHCMHDPGQSPGAWTAELSGADVYI